jgi:hypothetical protein
LITKVIVKTIKTPTPKGIIKSSTVKPFVARDIFKGAFAEKRRLLLPGKSASGEGVCILK